MFYQKRSIKEQAQRLPSAYQDNYYSTQIDRVEIDGNTLQGYFEYSFLSEKSYREQPVRSNDGSIPDINQYATFLTPRLIINYNMMDVEDYRKLMLLLQSKNEFTVTFYDIVLDKRVTHKMYAAPSQMPAIYQRYLMVLGIQDHTIELIGTNNGVGSYTIAYDYNLPPTSWESETTSRQVIAKNVSDIIGGINASYTYDGNTYPLNSEFTKELIGSYVFQGWNTKQDGTGFTYIDGDAYFVHSNMTLYAQWK